VNNADLQALLNLLKGSTMTSVPEPAAIWSFLVAAAALVIFRIRRVDGSHPRDGNRDRSNLRSVDTTLSEAYINASNHLPTIPTAMFEFGHRWFLKPSRQ
jgi:hypothetical protein